MDSLRGLNEAIEEEFGDSILSRDESLAVLMQVPGLGPPDLCWLQKSPKSSGFLSTSATSESNGYYHHVLGLDVSSSAAVCAYFAELTSRVEPMTLLQGLWYSSETVIDRGFFCSYDPISRLDVRCELCIPGGVVCGALDPEGTLHEVTPQLWANLLLASFLRHELLDPEMSCNEKTLIRYPLFNMNPATEMRLLEIVLEMYRNQVLPESLDLLTADQGLGCTPEHMDMVLWTLMQHFARRQRWGAALKFFKQLKTVYVGAAVYVAAVLREMEHLDKSLETLGEALDEQPDNVQLLVALGNECLYVGQVDVAAKLARQAVRGSTGIRPAWLLLSRCYLRQGLFGLSLTTLNVMPSPPAPVKEQKLLYLVEPPEPRSVTQPAMPAFSVEEALYKQMNVEEVSMEGSNALMSLPGAFMVSREPLDLSPWSDVGPQRITRAVLSAAYSILQELVAAMGWDSFLQLRTQLFLMHDEPGAKEALADIVRAGSVGGNSSGGRSAGSGLRATGSGGIVVPSAGSRSNTPHHNVDAGNTASMSSISRLSQSHQPPALGSRSSSSVPPFQQRTSSTSGSTSQAAPSAGVAGASSQVPVASSAALAQEPTISTSGIIRASIEGVTDQASGASDSNLTAVASMNQSFPPLVKASSGTLPADHHGGEIGVSQDERSSAGAFQRQSSSYSASLGTYPHSHHLTSTSHVPPVPHQTEITAAVAEEAGWKITYGVQPTKAVNDMRTMRGSFDDTFEVPHEHGASKPQGTTRESSSLPAAYTQEDVTESSSLGLVKEGGVSARNNSDDIISSAGHSSGTAERGISGGTASTAGAVDHDHSGPAAASGVSSFWSAMFRGWGGNAAPTTLSDVREGSNGSQPLGSTRPLAEGIESGPTRTVVPPEDQNHHYEAILRGVDLSASSSVSNVEERRDPPFQPLVDFWTSSEWRGDLNTQCHKSNSDARLRTKISRLESKRAQATGAMRKLLKKAQALVTSTVLKAPQHKRSSCSGQIVKRRPHSWKSAQHGAPIHKNCAAQHGAPIHKNCAAGRTSHVADKVYCSSTPSFLIALGGFYCNPSPCASAGNSSQIIPCAGAVMFSSNPKTWRKPYCCSAGARHKLTCTSHMAQGGAHWMDWPQVNFTASGPVSEATEMVGSRAAALGDGISQQVTSVQHVDREDSQHIHKQKDSATTSVVPPAMPNEQRSAATAADMEAHQRQRRHLLASLDEDRARAVLGQDGEEGEGDGTEAAGMLGETDDQDEGGQPLGGVPKRLSVRWLDELVTALWHDLQAYIDWMSADAESVRRSKNTLAAQVLALPAEAALALEGTSAAELKRLGMGLTAGDWMRRGLLAERLYHDSRALLAFRCCAKLIELEGIKAAASGASFTGRQTASTSKGPSSTCCLLAWTAIMRLATVSSDVKQALQAVQRIMVWIERSAPHLKHAGGSATSTRGPKPSPCPLAVVSCLHLLRGQMSGDEIKEVHQSLDVGPMHPSVEAELFGGTS